MTHAQPSPSENVLARFLALLGEAESIDDFTAERMSRCMKVPMQLASGDEYYCSETPATEQAWSIAHWRLLSGERRVELRIGDTLADGAEPAGDDNFLFSAFQEQLQAQYFTGAPRHDRYGQLQRHLFSRNRLGLQIFPRLVTGGTNPQAPWVATVYRILVS